MKRFFALTAALRHFGSLNTVLASLIKNGGFDDLASLAELMPSAGASTVKEAMEDLYSPIPSRTKCLLEKRNDQKASVVTIQELSWVGLLLLSNPPLHFVCRVYRNTELKQYRSERVGCQPSPASGRYFFDNRQ